MKSTSNGRSFLSTLVDRLFGSGGPSYALSTTALPFATLGEPPVLSFGLGSDGRPLAEIGAEIEAGEPLYEVDGAPMPSPVRGKLLGLRNAPDVRGRRPGRALLIEPAGGAAEPAFEPLDPAQTPPDALRERIRAAGVWTDELQPRPLLCALDSTQGQSRIVVLAADREPGVSASLQLLLDRRADLAPACALLARLGDARGVVAAVPAAHAAEATAALAGAGVAVLPIDPHYPSSLEPVVAGRAGEGAVVVALETALAALEAIRDGRVQAHKALTVIGPQGKAIGNYLVPIGAQLAHLFAELNLTPRQHDKVVMGGPMRGYTQYSLDAAVDAGVDAVMLIRDGAYPTWSDEPCINCGACIDACPLDLQVQLIGRYCEFGLFERLDELTIGACFECGLCAAACTARRPLLQLIRLGKGELAKEEPPDPEDASEPQPLRCH